MISKKISPLGMRVARMEAEMYIPTIPKHSVVTTLLLECPNFGKAHGLVRDVALEALIDFLLNLTDVDARVDDEWYYSLLREHVYVDEDLVTCFFTSQEEQSFRQDSEGHLARYGQQINDYLESVAQLNEDAINQMYSDLTLQNIEVSFTLQNHIMLIVRGTQYDSLSIY